MRQSPSCIPPPVKPDNRYLNQKSVMPFGVSKDHVLSAMMEFVGFLEFIDAQLQSKQMARLEEMLMPANFSSMVGEFMCASLPKYCKTIVKNTYHNGHPDLLPAKKYAADAAQHAGVDGIEIKASRYLKGWQGHNPEDVWIMVFVFEGGRPRDAGAGVSLVPFRFALVCGALLKKADWLFAGRSEESRRTITASVTKSGYDKMMSNWIYRIPDLGKSKPILTSIEDAEE
jgi:hypothetical protein